jgi:hypothetical protein
MCDSPAKVDNDSVQMPSPPKIFARNPSCIACLASGPPVASVPPYMIASGFSVLIFVSTAGLERLRLDQHVIFQ